jgi:quinol monooxygenase YgiN
MGVRPANLDQVTALAVRACQAAAGEPGTLRYDWHYAEEHGSLLVLETYADSSAHLAHMGTEGHGELMSSFMGLIDALEFFVLGEPSTEHREALAGIPGAHFTSALASR